jgi:hypothetical protein
MPFIAKEASASDQTKGLEIIPTDEKDANVPDCIAVMTVSLLASYILNTMFSPEEELLKTTRNAT